MHDNPDTSRFVVRVDSFGANGQPGSAPNVSDIENFLAEELTIAYPESEFSVEVEERLA